MNCASTLDACDGAVVCGPLEIMARMKLRLYGANLYVRNDYTSDGVSSVKPEIARGGRVSALSVAISGSSAVKVSRAAIPQVLMDMLTVR